MLIKIPGNIFLHYVDFDEKKFKFSELYTIQNILSININ